ncbi:hypothetical protein NEFER03_0930 [Nematocida sp. LUAm3]|nr:hypothetical protein NEFER03_0930 [Nematocida sp. LUAm3]KAI5174948.1 hypothetical protein NEFER02_1048 [Nematocida sp. LUAm2]KAI5177453.1 hypothetical protein NEFER01_0703 [Nematocida sp. LUAm1]
MKIGTKSFKRSILCALSFFWAGICTEPSSSSSLSVEEIQKCLDCFDSTLIAIIWKFELQLVPEYPFLVDDYLCHIDNNTNYSTELMNNTYNVKDTNYQQNVSDITLNAIHPNRNLLALSDFTKKYHKLLLHQLNTYFIYSKYTRLIIPLNTWKISLNSDYLFKYNTKEDLKTLLSEIENMPFMCFKSVQANLMCKINLSMFEVLLAFLNKCKSADVEVIFPDEFLIFNHSIKNVKKKIEKKGIYNPIQQRVLTSFKITRGSRSHIILVIEQLMKECSVESFTLELYPDVNEINWLGSIRWVNNYSLIIRGLSFVHRLNLTDLSRDAFSCCKILEISRCSHIASIVGLEDLIKVGSIQELYLDWDIFVGLNTSILFSSAPNYISKEITLYRAPETLKYYYFNSVLQNAMIYSTSLLTIVVGDKRDIYQKSLPSCYTKEIIDRLGISYKEMEVTRDFF